MACAQETGTASFHRFPRDITVRDMASPPKGNVCITEYAEDVINPEPIMIEDSEELVDEYLSPGRLKALTGVEDLDEVQTLEMAVDTRENSLGNFGSLLPKLQQLRLNNSVIASVRDLGTSLRYLQVLWMARCGLQDLDGISSMSALRELYLAYNDISDVSPCSLLEELQVLDLEGNNIDDVAQVEFLALCPKLTTMTLEGNPVCLAPNPDAENNDMYDYRGTIKQSVPTLLYLDDEPLSSRGTGLSKPTSLSAERLVVNESIKESLGSNEDIDDGEGRPLSGSSRPGSAWRPGSARPGSARRRPDSAIARLGTAARPATAARPGTAGRPGTAAAGAQRPETAGSEEFALDEELSDLTRGEVICGLPSRGLKSRKGKLPTGLSALPTVEQIQASPFSHLLHRPEHTYDEAFDADVSKEDLFAELKAWRQEYEGKIKQRYVEMREPQVLKISHDEAADVEDGSDASVSDDDVELPVDEDSQLYLRSQSPVHVPSPPSSSPVYRPSPPPSSPTHRPSPPPLSPTHHPSPPPRSPQGPPPSQRLPSKLSSDGVVRPRTAADFRVRRYRPRTKEETDVERLRSSAPNEDTRPPLPEERSQVRDGRAPGREQGTRAKNIVSSPEEDTGSAQPGPAGRTRTYRPAARPARTPPTEVNPTQPVIRSTHTPPRRQLPAVPRPATARAAMMSQRLPNRLPSKSKPPS
ncbi:PREDICTED: leucine-rich repeat-containing protein 56-like isoform X2 [Branchiostoma belcheri]|uniref:Leucine-rich repeat-containing protein 56-like isoform X2 n=1 Tax=Branchiostoma belcheri TaxID=7741 RepID=A0A6P4ZFK0_BRABE|nr:PREDICTED: leucine-rich repeat-containing protein 56-like isoform X2 [Branchiostoma belcheri]